MLLCVVVVVFLSRVEQISFFYLFKFKSIKCCNLGKENDALFRLKCSSHSLGDRLWKMVLAKRNTDGPVQANVLLLWPHRLTNKVTKIERFFFIYFKTPMSCEQLSVI